MSTRTASSEDIDNEPRRAPRCSAPSCWEAGEPVKIDGTDADPPVLCEFHAKSYLGVSS